jgi:hypothetical protein
MRAIAFLVVFVVCLASCPMRVAAGVVWHNGSVVLKTNQVIAGEISRQGNGLLLVKDAQGKVSVYPALKVSSFRFYDKEQDINRIFIGVHHRYFERVVFGKISVLRIQKFFDQRIDEKHPALYEYYIEEGKVISSLKSFRKRYFQRIKDALDQQLVSYRHLDPNTSHGAVSMIILYNRSVPVLISQRAR